MVMGERAWPTWCHGAAAGQHPADDDGADRPGDPVGGMFTVVKVRKGSRVTTTGTRLVAHPAGTVAYRVDDKRLNINEDKHEDLFGICSIALALGSS
jgi:hypothetical protein